MSMINNPDIPVAQKNYYKSLMQPNQIYQNDVQNNFQYNQYNPNFVPNQNRMPVDFVKTNPTNYVNMHPNIQNQLAKASNGVNMQHNYLPNINTVTPITNVSNQQPKNVSELIKRYVSASTEAEKLQLSNQIRLTNPVAYQQLIMAAKSKVNRL